MEDRVLVTYATRSGSAEGVAKAIAGSLRADGAEIDLVPVKKVSDVTSYKAVILGSAIRAGKLMSEAVKFVKANQEALSQMPVAYFVVCLTMQDDTEENRGKAMAYLDALREQAPQVKPVDVGLFAGALDFKKLPLPMRLIMKRMKAVEGDFRNWDSIKAWAVKLRPMLLGE